MFAARAGSCGAARMPMQRCLLSLEGCLKPLKKHQNNRFSTFSFCLRSQFLRHPQRATVALGIGCRHEAEADVLWKGAAVCGSNLCFV